MRVDEKQARFFPCAKRSIPAIPTKIQSYETVSFISGAASLLVLVDMYRFMDRTHSKSFVTALVVPGVSRIDVSWTRNVI
jgi:hypothetical protein